MFVQLIPIIIAITVAIVWWGNTTTKEKAISAAKRACGSGRVQLLDHTVSLKKYRLIRDHSGSIKIARLYVFEFSIDGDERKQGFISFIGMEIKELKLLLDR